MQTGQNLDYSSIDERIDRMSARIGQHQSPVQVQYVAPQRYLSNPVSQMDISVHALESQTPISQYQPVIQTFRDYVPAHNKQFGAIRSSQAIPKTHRLGLMENRGQKNSIEKRQHNRDQRYQSQEDLFPQIYQ